MPNLMTSVYVIVCQEVKLEKWLQKQNTVKTAGDEFSRHNSYFKIKAAKVFGTYPKWTDNFTHLQAPIRFSIW
jgi:hypothetical protein